MNEDAFLKQVNPELYEKTIEDARIEAELSAKDAKNKELEDTIAELKAKIAKGK